MPSQPEPPDPDRRSQPRLPGRGFPLLTPADATMIDCGPCGIGIETNTHLAVGSRTPVHVFQPGAELSLVGRVRWARMIDSRSLANGDSEPIFRAGLSFDDGPVLDAWRRLVSTLLTPRSGRQRPPRPRRRVVRWRRSRSA